MGDTMINRTARWLAVTIAALAMASCMQSEEAGYQGWAEADLVFIAPDEAGRVQTLSVREGDAAAPGLVLFTLDDDLQQAGVRQAQAVLTNARQAFQRADKLLTSRAGSQMIYGNAEAALREAEAHVNTAETRLVRRKVMSVPKGTVQRIYFRPGEMVAAGRPVVSILPPENMKVRFYVPQAALPRFSAGQTVVLKCDGCASGMTARVSYISSSAEYTPPVIYSLEERAKLVYLIEARPEHPESLRAGQPVNVALPDEREARK